MMVFFDWKCFWMKAFVILLFYPPIMLGLGQDFDSDEDSIEVRIYT
jgi:hypothetical protein